MRIGSLFSGIGGLELGLEAALGGRTVWQVEREAFPRRVLAKHWPDADRSVTDVCEAGAHNLAQVDLICGGFPCQDISSAGKGAGITGAKSGLWREYARVVREVGPRFVVVENSPMLTARGLGVVLGDLAGLGFDAEWARIGACDVGAPHRRWRLFIVAWHPDCIGEGAKRGVCQREDTDCSGVRELNPDADGLGLLGEQEFWVQRADVLHADGLCEAANAHREPIRVQPRRRRRSSGAEASKLGRDGEVWSPRHVAHPHRAQPSVRRGSTGQRVAGFRPGSGSWLSEPAVGRVAHGVSAGLDCAGPRLGPHGRKRLRALGNAVVPQVAYEVGMWLRNIIERECAS